MTLWLDAQVSPLLADWIKCNFNIFCFALRDLGLRDASDHEIFMKGKTEGVIIITKDSDFCDLVRKHKSPPKIIWLTCGNTSNESLKQIFSAKLLSALEILDKGEELIEISDWI
ncbi:MAG: DUF5615 family PIN-like protein [Bacteroidia bacterium]